MKAPTEEHIKKWNRKNRPVVPVVLDPVVAQKLRPHQVEGNFCPMRAFHDLTIEKVSSSCTSLSWGCENMKARAVSLPMRCRHSIDFLAFAEL